MESRGVLPVLIPGVMFQLFIQVHYIKRCLQDTGLTPAKRCLYAVMIAVFNMPAAAFYLFKARAKHRICARDSRI